MIKFELGFLNLNRTNDIPEFVAMRMKNIVVNHYWIFQRLLLIYLKNIHQYEYTFKHFTNKKSRSVNCLSIKTNHFYLSSLKLRILFQKIISRDLPYN